MVGDHLHRNSNGLTPAHRELIKLLAQIAVSDYLEEIDPTEAAENGDKEGRRGSQSCA